MNEPAIIEIRTRIECSDAYRYISNTSNQKLDLESEVQENTDQSKVKSCNQDEVKNPGIPQQVEANSSGMWNTGEWVGKQRRSFVEILKGKKEHVETEESHSIPVNEGNQNTNQIGESAGKETGHMEFPQLISNFNTGNKEGDSFSASSEENANHAFDLNNEPFNSQHQPSESGEDGNGQGRSPKTKHKDKSVRNTHSSKSAPRSLKLKDVVRANYQRSNKKRDRAQNSQISFNNSECSDSISAEVNKTVNIGMEVGFQLQGFDEELRHEIEVEDVDRRQK
ncbi:hypothetical protein L2E82_49909 [Cichorium intybus]|uniref:Uncharacterized protein n=1 Tax=Cichorium intybus TaxID=13427 RepID=A0ACB8Z0N4_CICIN|nr:hypothetical protein L2E82_49909 [Cichorium intybus]